MNRNSYPFILMSFILMTFFCQSIKAQQYVKGDMDGDGAVTIFDVSKVVDVVLGKESIQPVTISKRENTPWYASDTLRVLDIGNSFTEDATYYLGALVEASGVDVSNMALYMLNRGGVSYKSWVDAYNGRDTKNYQYRKIFGDANCSVAGYGYLLETGYNETSLLRNVLSKVKWDLIIIHQVSTYADDYDSWFSEVESGYLEELVSIIKDNQPKAKLGCLLTHSSNSTAKYMKLSTQQLWKRIADSTKKLKEHYHMDVVIPYGTAIENLRMTSYDDKYNFCRDDHHLAHGLARYTAACSYFQALVTPFTGVDVIGNPCRIEISDEDESTSNFSKPIAITDETAALAQMAAYLSVGYKWIVLNPEIENGRAGQQ